MSAEILALPGTGDARILATGVLLQRPLPTLPADSRPRHP